MIINILLILIYKCFNFNNTNKLNNGIYNILFDKFYLYISGREIKLSEKFDCPKTFFRIIKVNKELKDDSYYIEEISSKYKLSYLDDNELILKKNKNKHQLWKFIKNNNNYKIKNINACYIKVNNLKLFCNNIHENNATEFQLIKIYNEVEEDSNITNNDILEKEPIDIIIKYIDLRDPNLKRKSIRQIDKDFDNEELRYSIRSILTNIPWVRKIFILMPNEKVRFFKEYNLIKDKIIYVRDKDLLGFDSSNTRAFMFRYWDMKKFGISDNIIVMDDDYFIGKKIPKSKFFYVEDGKVHPSITTSRFLKMNEKYVLENYKKYKQIALNSKVEQTGDISRYTQFITYSFILNIFNITKDKNVYIPVFTHNAIPINLKELKEIYDIINNSKYKSATLNSLYRDMEGLQYQVFVISYTFLKYDKKVNNIPFSFIPLNKSINANYKSSLFCINKSPGYYPDLVNYITKLILENLFPTPSPFEINDNSILKSSFKIDSQFDKELIEYKNKVSKMITKKEFSFMLFEVFVIIISLIYKIKYSYYYYLFK